jgi:predicted O-methyltransferase YrrM
MSKGLVEENALNYLQKIGVRENAIVAELRTETLKVPMGDLAITPPDSIQLLDFLVKVFNVKRAIEVGVFTGCSSLVIAQAMPEEGYLLACEKQTEHNELAKSFWQKAGVAEKIDLQIAPAIETLEKRLAEGEQGSYDFAFVDANKSAYETYYELCLQLVRPGGLLVLDNTLVFGRGGKRVFDEAVATKSHRLVAALNEKIQQDPRVDVVVLPVGSGMTLLRKR